MSKPKEDNASGLQVESINIPPPPRSAEHVKPMDVYVTRNETLKAEVLWVLNKVVTHKIKKKGN